MNELLYIKEINIFFTVWFLVLGFCIGSFLNVVILRGFSGESIVFPPSKCPNCGNKLKWWMNIPILSYLFLRGKCYYCKNGISIQYPIVEGVTGVFFALIFYNFHFSLETLFFIIAFCALLVMSVCDIKESVIFDVHSYFLIAAGVLYNLTAFSFGGLINSLIGAVCGFLIYEALARSGYLLAGQRAFGEGDSLIACGIGAFFGWKMIIVSVVISVFVMAIFTLPYFLIYAHKAQKKQTVAAILFAFLIVIVSVIVSKAGIIKTFGASLVFLILVMASALFCSFLILNDAKTKKENGKEGFCALPFGPAMAVSFLVIMFYLNPINQYIDSFLAKF